MQVGIVGLGRMGLNMARRLINGNHEVVGFNRTSSKVDEFIKEGGKGAYSLAELASMLNAPRTILVMLPAGDPTEQHIIELTKLLFRDDTIINGGNDFYKEDIRRAEFMKEKGIHYLDAGISGGIWGLTMGYCSMIGGDHHVFDRVEPLFKTLAPENGYLLCGPVGSGHYVKMVHNGIEYGMMEAIGEGFELLKASPYGKDLELEKVARLWNHGSVIRSWLLELLAEALKEDPGLSEIKGYVEDSGEGRWMVEQAMESGVAVTVLAHSLFKRFQSRQKEVFSNKILAALRNAFGGHIMIREEECVRQDEAGAGKVQAAKPDKR